MRGVWLGAACGLFALIALAACGDDELSPGELHARLHDVAGEACDQIEAGGATDDAIATAIAEAAEFGASEEEAREILEESCPDLLG